MVTIFGGAGCIVFAATIFYVIKEYVRRAGVRRQNQYFEVWSDSFIGLMSFLLFSGMFTFFGVFLIIESSESIADAAACLVFNTLFAVLAVNYMRPKVRVYKDGVLLVSRFLSFRRRSLRDVGAQKFNTLSLKIVFMDGQGLRVSNYCINFEKLVVALKARKKEAEARV
ncbi:MAG: hypothetical protein M0R40_11620 [Firmicutes bacterium]|nr:hypothetical protein [Bacillota bacterium]